MTGTRLLLRRRAQAGRRRDPDSAVADLFTRTYPAPAPLPAAVLRVYTATELVIGGLPVIRLTPRGRRSGRHLIYTHGGGYVRPLVRPHWRVLARATLGTGVTVSVPLYRLAPEGCANDAYLALRAVYRHIAAEADAENITLAGDSSGGGLALGQAIDHRAYGEPSSSQVILFSPWLDLTLSNQEIPSLGPRDPTLVASQLRAAGALWARDRDPRDPLLSPVFADLTGLPPVHVFQGGHDILAADARVLSERLQQAGNRGTTTWAPDGFHVYVGATWTPESRATLSAVRALLGGEPCAPSRSYQDLGRQNPRSERVRREGLEPGGD
jgi:epsilon-lactone hydrolase